MKEIEGHIKKIYDEIVKVVPSTHHISFCISRHPTAKERECYGGDTWIWGSLHCGGSCEMYNSISELTNIVKRREILFRNFGG